ncbi:histone acetyltransferase 1 [Exophiala xenobiotica]|uniref:Histone acetyltransferase type B catalytic subunit n=1 Tax=Lithohypha guttulata TaxID=1690604 RepID=A0ABR0KI13_9EURO|nr:histone acetyltransferase 1 [Lithohypha guttulata]KAK5311636.1 histone acetyltransferase 1 [Exophiala xenobiotica]
MTSLDEEWSVSANDVVKLSLVRAGTSGLQTIDEFSPTFTYPIFGEAEQIFGYKGLDIGIQFASHDGSPHVDISYDKKFPAVKSTQALDLIKTLKEFLPESAFQQGYDEQVQNDEDTKDWKPPGELIHKYSKKGRNFEVWAGSLLDPRVNKLVENIQILVLFYIEAGSQLNLDEVDWSLDRWRVYFTFEKIAPPTPQAASYSFIGYSTTYRFWRPTFPKSKPTKASPELKKYPDLPPITHHQLESRLRISQFLLLPPHQKSGHGSQLYRAIYNEVLSTPAISELTVEDPSEEFDQLRDSCDWKTLEPQFKAANIAIDADTQTAHRRIQRVPTKQLTPLETLHNIRTRNKIAPRQFARLVEMYTLSLIPFSHRSSGGANLTKVKIQKHMNKDPMDRMYYWWRILLKQRIYRKNKDALVQLDFEEKYSAIEDSARGQEDEYEGLLMLFALRQAGAAGLVGDGDSESAGSSSKSRKRKVIEEDEDDDEEVVEEVEVSIPKRART